MYLGNKKALGLIAALGTATIWATFLLATRFAVTGDFTVEEVLVLRLLPSAIIMAPFMVQLGIVPKGQSWLRTLTLMIGASAVFPYIVSSGLAHAPASDGGALAPGMLPFWTALAMYFLTGEVPEKSRIRGLVLIMIGAMFVGLIDILLTTEDGSWKGHVMFLTGSGLFAIYSVIFGQSHLTPMQGLVIGLFWGAVLIVPFLFLTGNVNFSTKQLDDIILMIIIQSLVIGILAAVLFNYAVKLLGAAQTGAFGALTPILSLVGGIFLLNEKVTFIAAFGVVLVASGVFLASGIQHKSK